MGGPGAIDGLALGVDARDREIRVERFRQIRKGRLADQVDVRIRRIDAAAVLRQRHDDRMSDAAHLLVDVVRDAALDAGEQLLEPLRHVARVLRVEQRQRHAALRGRRPGSRSAYSPATAPRPTDPARDAQEEHAQAEQAEGVPTMLRRE